MAFLAFLCRIPLYFNHARLTGALRPIDCVASPGLTTTAMFIPGWPRPVTPVDDGGGGVAGRMSGAATFLGTPEAADGHPDVVVLQLAYELTTSYGSGTAGGPAACIEASAQVELYDALLEEDLPAGARVRTLPVVEPEAATLLGQLDELAAAVLPWADGRVFPLVLGGEHGILPPVLAGMAVHPVLDGDLGGLTVVQVDAHADLRDELDGEPWSHACVARRALDLGVGQVLQVGQRAVSRQEAAFAAEDPRVDTWYARDLLSPCSGERAWMSWLERLRSLKGPVHLTIDIDGLDVSLVPATGTPVPGGLGLWHLFETIETLFANPEVIVLSADVNEIVPSLHDIVTQFTAAMLATKVLAAHLAARRDGRWAPMLVASDHRPVSFSDVEVIA